MGKYQEDARLLLEYVGGKENIAAVSHCVSRMRFVLNDPAKADVAKIEVLKSAKGTFTQAGQFQVITGLHHMSNAIDMQLIADFGGTMLWPMIALSNIAQGSAVLGMIYLQRKNAAAQEVNVPSCISCYLGVTEPAMFGVNLKFHFPFICGMIGSAIAAVVCVATSTTANAIGVGGIPGILSIQPAYMLSFALCMAIAIVVPFVLTVIVGKKKGVA